MTRFEASRFQPLSDHELLSLTRCGNVMTERSL